MADRRPTLTDGLAGRSVASRLVVACSASYQSLLPPVTVPYRTPCRRRRSALEKQRYTHTIPTAESPSGYAPYRTYCLGTEGGVENRSHAVLNAECQKCRKPMSSDDVEDGAAGAVSSGDRLGCLPPPYQSPRRTQVRPPRPRRQAKRARPALLPAVHALRESSFRRSCAIKMKQAYTNTGKIPIDLVAVPAAKQMLAGGANSRCRSAITEPAAIEKTAPSTGINGKQGEEDAGICKPYLAGMCQFGRNCFNIHPHAEQGIAFAEVCSSHCQWGDNCSIRRLPLHASGRLPRRDRAIVL